MHPTVHLKGGNVQQFFKPDRSASAGRVLCEKCAYITRTSLSGGPWRLCAPFAGTNVVCR